MGTSATTNNGIRQGGPKNLYIFFGSLCSPPGQQIHTGFQDKEGLFQGCIF